MRASTPHGRHRVSSNRGAACRGASPSRTEASVKGLERSPLPAGTRIRGTSTGLAVVNRRSAFGGGSPVVPQSRGLPQKEGSNGRLSRSRDTRYGTP